MSLVYLLLGTNLGNKEANLVHSTEKLVEKELIILKKSSVYETEPWGFEHPESFYNQVFKIETGLSPADLMNLLIGIEKDMGRFRTMSVYEARIIDIDILFYDNLVIHSDLLIVPHPKMHLRRFALVPMCEIAPLNVHPYLNRTMQELLNQCIDKKRVYKK